MLGQINLRIGYCLFVVFFSAGIFAQVRRETQTCNPDIRWQTIQFNQLVKAGNFDQAEVPLKLLECYVSSQEIEKFRANLSLRRQDYTSAKKQLTTFFEGGPDTASRSVGGCEPVRDWYWFLLVQNGETKKADVVLEDLLRSPVYVARGAERLNLKDLTSVKLAQVYMSMGIWYFHKLNYLRAARYFDLAKIADPKVIIDPLFMSRSKAGHIKSMVDAKEAEESYPILDHTVFQMKLGRPIRIY